MKKKILTLTLAFALLFTMSVPSFAATKSIFEKPTVSYLALGDSVAAGCKNMNFELGEDPEHNPGFMDFQRFYDEDGNLSWDADTAMKNTNVYQVPNSFVYKIAKAINADQQTSFNGSYIGLRAMDYCHALDIAEYEEGDYTDAYNESMSQATAADIAIEKDVIIKQQEDMMRQGISNMIGQQWYDPANYTFKTDDQGNPVYIENEQEAEAYIKEYIEWYAKQDEMIENIISYNKTLKDVYNLPFNTLFNDVNKEALKEAIANSDVITIEIGLNDLMASTYNETILGQLLGYFTGGMVTPIEVDDEDLLGAALRTLKKDYYYYDQLIKYVNENKKKDAIVVVGTLIDPIRDKKFYDYSQMDMTQMTPEEIQDMMEHPENYPAPDNLRMNALVNMLDPVIARVFPMMNKHIQAGAVTVKPTLHGLETVRNYYVADLSATTLNPPADGDVEYIQHPNVKGQKYIADSFLAQIYKAQVEKGRVSNTLKAAVKEFKTSVAVKLDRASVIVKAWKGLKYFVKDFFAKLFAPEDVNPVAPVK